MSELNLLVNRKKQRWQENVLEMLPHVIESIQEKGYNPSDIGILVRDNREGACVLKRIISYSSALPDEMKSRFNIVSNDSLLLVNAPVINFIIAVLKVLDNPGNMIGRALMLRYFLLATGRRDAETVALESENLVSYSSGFFPADYEKFLEEIRYFVLMGYYGTNYQVFWTGQLFIQCCLS